MYAALQCGAAGARLPVVSVESHKKAPFVILTVMLLSIQAVTASGDDGPLSEVVELNLSNRCGNSATRPCLGSQNPLSSCISGWLWVALMWFWVALMIMMMIMTMT
jgi:hypothetical protein